MRSANENEEVNQAQRTYARLAGILLLGAIIIAIGSGAILSNIAGDGTFAETAARIAASEHLYRVALSSDLIVTLSSTLLAFALYVTLKPVNSLLAQLGMSFSPGEHLFESQPWNYAFGADSALERFLSLDGKIVLSTEKLSKYGHWASKPDGLLSPAHR
jgi:Domain of unknown function (DUF4386)